MTVNSQMCRFAANQVRVKGRGRRPEDVHLRELRLDPGRFPPLFLLPELVGGCDASLLSLSDKYHTYNQTHNEATFLTPNMVHRDCFIGLTTAFLQAACMLCRLTAGAPTVCVLMA